MNSEDPNPCPNSARSLGDIQRPKDPKIYPDLSNTRKEALGSLEKRQPLKGAENKGLLNIEEKGEPEALAD